MAQTLKLKRSAVSGNAPGTSDLALGEIAINTYDGKIFIKKDDGTESIVTFSAGGNAGSIEEDSFTGDGSTVAFTISTAPSTEENLLVFIDAAFQNRDSFTVSGTTVTFDTAPDNTSSVRIYHVIPGTVDDGILTVAKFAASAIVTEAEGIASNDNDTTIPTSAAVKDYVDTQVATVDTLPEVLANGNTTGGTDISVSTGDDITFADSSKALFGDDSDLQIYSSGSYSFIREVGTGGLYLDTNGDGIYLRGTTGNENMVRALKDGAVTLFYDGSQRLATTSTGIDVTGTATMDGLTVDGTNGTFAVSTTGNDVTMSRPSSNYFYASNASGDLFLGAGGTPTFLKIDNSGDISFYEDTGTTAKLFWDASAESLGIGTTSPAQALEIAGSVRIDNGASFTAYEVYRDNILYGRVGGGSNQFTIQASNNKNVNIFDDSGSGLTVKDGGNVGIGKTSPSAKLHVDGDVYVDTGHSIFADFFKPYSGTLATYGSSTSTQHYFLGNVGIGMSSPSAKLHIDSGASNDGLYIDSDTAWNSTISLQNNGSTKWLLRNVGSGANAFSIYNSGGSSEAIRIDSSNNVGIGDSSPENRLHVKGAANTSTTVQIESASNQYAPKILFDGLVGASADYLLGSIEASWDGHTNKVAAIRFESGSDTTNKDDGLISFWTSDAGSTLDERMRIDASGNVGIGTNDPAAKLHVGPNVLLNTYTTDRTTLAVSDITNGAELILRGQSPRLWFDATGGGNGQMYMDGAELQIYSGSPVSAGSQRLTIDASGNVGINQTNPSHRLQVSVDANGAFIKRDVASNAANLSEFNSHRSLLLLNRNSGSYLAFGGNGSRTDIQATDLAGTPTAKIINLNPFGGNVGIGTTSPSDKLDVAGALRLTANISFDSNKSGRIYKASNHGLAFHGVTGTENDFAMFTPSGQLMVTNPTGTNNVSLIPTASGNVGIGLNNPSEKLHIYGTGATISGKVEAGDGNQASLDLKNSEGEFRLINDGGELYVYDSTDAAERFRIDTSGDSTFSGNIITTGYLAGPATFTIDPAAVGDNTGTVVIAGNLQVDGTTTTINSTTLTVDDKRITLASGSLNAAAADGAGIEVEISGATYPSIKYDGTNDEWDFNKPINLTGDGHDLLINSADYELLLLGNRGSTGVNLDKAYLRMKAEGTNTVVIDTAGNSYFNGGNVGIGETSPTLGLSVGNAKGVLFGPSTGASTYISPDHENTINGGYGLDTDTADVWINYRGYQNGTSRFRDFRVGNGKQGLVAFFDGSSGNVGIGTDSPVAKLDVLGTTGGPTVFDYSYATNSGIRIHGDEAGMDIVGTDANNHASSLLLRNGNEGFAFINNSTSDRLELKSFNATADNFTVHSTGTNVSNLVNLLTLEKTGNVGIGTNDPAFALHVIPNDGTNVVARFESSDAQVWVDLHDSNSGNYGCLLGHDSAADHLFMVADASVSRKFVVDTQGQVGIGNTDPQARLQIEEYGINTTETSTTATTQVAIHTFAAATFRSARFTVQVTNSTDSTYHLTEILMIHDGTTPSITEYGTIFTGSAAEATFDADILSGNVRLLATPASTDAMEFKVVSHSITT